MASQVLDLGADAFGSEGNWEGAILVDPALIDGGGTAYLRQFRLIANSAIVRLAASPDADPQDAGPEFTVALETANEAFTLAEAGGGAALVLKGPAHSDNLFSDSSEVYYWTPDNGAAWHEWALGTGSGVVTLTLDDGQAPPPPAISISATFDGAAGSLSLALTKRSLLTLADFASSGLELDVLALIEVGAPAIYGTAPRPVSGALLDGELGMGATDEPITQLRFAGGTRITLNDNGPLAMSDYWANGGPGDDLTLHLQTEQGHISFPVAGNRGNAGGNYVVFNVPAEQQAFVAGIVEGERLLFAFTRAAAANQPIAATFAAAAASLSAGLTKRALADRPIAASFQGAAASISLGLTKRALADRPIAAPFQGAAASISLGLTKRALATRPIAATFQGAAALIFLRLTKGARPTQPIAATFAAAAASVALALAKPAALPESVRRRIRSTSGSWDGVRVGDLVAVGRATSYAREVEVATVRYDDRNVRLTLVDYPETLYAGERPLSDFRPGDSIPGPYLGPACPVIRSIHTGVDDVGQNRAGTNPILIRIEIAPDDSSRPAARAYIVQCRQSEFVGSAAQNDDPVLQSLPDAEYREQPGSDWEDCGVVEKPGQGTLILSSGFAIGERIDIRVIALDDEGRASCWRVYEDYLVELPVAAAPGGRLHFGEIDPEAAPDDAVGEDGDRFIADDGRTWVKVDGAWVFQGDFTSEGTKIHSGEVAEDALPPGDVGTIGDLYFAYDGRWWEKTDETTWTPRGDLTGPAGSDIFTGSGAPQPGLGKDGDVYVRDDGIVWRKAGGVWTQTGVDLTGKPGSKLFSGEVADGAKPPAGTGSVDDFFLASDGRFWEKTAAATWTLRGDLTGPPGSNIFTGSGAPQAGQGKDGDVYVRDDGIVWRKVGGVWTQTGVDLTGKPGSKLFSGEVADGAKPPAGTGSVDDFFLASDGRFWEKTAAGIWTLRGDLTGPPGSNTFTGFGEPQPALGKDGDVYVRDDGTLWTRANGVWTYTGVDLTGPPGASLIPGDVAEGQSPDASLGKVGDIFFNLDGRVWEKTDDTTWTSRGDLTGPRGASLIPGVVATDALPPANVGNVGDTFLAADGRFWQKTDATTWTYIDDLTGPSGEGGINPRGEWATGNSYAVGDSVFRNFSFSETLRILGTSITIPRKSSRAYLCKLAHTADANNAPLAAGTNDYWGAITGDTSFGDDSTVVDPTPVVTTRPFTGYQLAASTPATPPSSTENPPDDWDLVRPPQHATLSIYKLVGTRTYDDDVFRSAVWAVTFVQGPRPPGPVVVTTRPFDGYMHATSTPPTPGSSEESPSGWTVGNNPSFTDNLYRLVGTRTYHDLVFQFASWAVTFVRGPIVVETTPFTGYLLATSTPATPPSSTENPPSAWQSTHPPQHATLSIYKLVGTRTYDDDVFRSAVWAVTFVQGPSPPGPVVTTTTVTRYQLAASTPATPPSSTENPPAGWDLVAHPPQHVAFSIYKLVGTRTYDDDVFRSAVWAVTFVQGPSPPGPVVTTRPFTGYQLAASTPATPPSSTENPPAGWDLVAHPPQHVAFSIYKLVGTRTYDDDVFRSAVWAVTFVQGPSPPFRR